MGPSSRMVEIPRPGWHHFPSLLIAHAGVRSRVDVEHHHHAMAASALPLLQNLQHTIRDHPVTSIVEYDRTDDCLNWRTTPATGQASRRSSMASGHSGQRPMLAFSSRRTLTCANVPAKMPRDWRRQKITERRNTPIFDVVAPHAQKYGKIASNALI